MWHRPASRPEKWFCERKGCRIIVQLFQEALIRSRRLCVLEKSLFEPHITVLVLLYIFFSFIALCCLHSSASVFILTHGFSCFLSFVFSAQLIYSSCLISFFLKFLHALLKYWLFSQPLLLHHPHPALLLCLLICLSLLFQLFNPEFKWRFSRILCNFSVN